MKITILIGDPLFIYATLNLQYAILNLQSKYLYDRELSHMEKLRDRLPSGK